MTQPQEKMMFSVPEAAKLTGISRSQAYHLCATGAWPHVRIGRSVRIPSRALERWIETNTIGDSEEAYR